LVERFQKRIHMQMSCSHYWKSYYRP